MRAILIVAITSLCATARSDGPRWTWQVTEYGPNGISEQPGCLRRNDGKSEWAVKLTNGNKKKASFRYKVWISGIDRPVISGFKLLEPGATEKTYESVGVSSTCNVRPRIEYENFRLL